MQYVIYIPAKSFEVWLQWDRNICISYNTSKSALPDIYARGPRASAYISLNIYIYIYIYIYIVIKWL